MLLDTSINSTWRNSDTIRAETDSRIFCATKHAGLQICAIVLDGGGAHTAALLLLQTSFSGQNVGRVGEGEFYEENLQNLAGLEEQPSFNNRQTPDRSSGHTDYKTPGMFNASRILSSSQPPGEAPR